MREFFLHLIDLGVFLAVCLGLLVLLSIAISIVR